MTENEDYQTLLIKYNKLQGELETKNQSLYDCQRQLKTAEALEQDYQEEIRVLRSEESRIDEKWKIKLQQTEEHLSTVKITYDERIGALEKDLDQKDKQLILLKEELEIVIRLNEKTDELDRSYEVNELKIENETLQTEFDKLVERNSELETQCKNNEDSITKLKVELEELKESYDCKRNELDEAKDLIQTLQDETTCLKLELESLKSKPLVDGSQGNSLFAEVDDRRVQLQTNFNKMKIHYKEMKNDRANLLKQIACLQTEKANLCMRLQNEQKQIAEDENAQLVTAKAHIATLEKLIDKYRLETEKNMKNFLTDSNQMELKFFNNTLKSHKEEIETLRHQLQYRSLNEMFLTKDLVQERKEVRRLNLELTICQTQIEDLKRKLDEIETSDNSKTKTETRGSSFNRRESMFISSDLDILDETKDDLVQSNKENEVKEKRVQFHPEAVEPKASNTGFHRTRRVIISKPIRIVGPKNSS